MSSGVGAEERMSNTQQEIDAEGAAEVAIDGGVGVIDRGLNSHFLDTASEVDFLTQEK